MQSSSDITARGKSRSEIETRSKAAIKDELVYQLSSKTEINWSRLEITQKYHKQAEFVLYRMNVYDSKRPPIFIINTSDLTQSLKVELEKLENVDYNGLDKVVTEAIQTLFDGINSRYYHVSGLPYKVTWRFKA